MNDPSAPAGPRDSEVQAALEEYLERIDRGEAVDREKFLAQHAQIAEKLRSFIAAEEELRRLARTRLGDDRLERSTQSFALDGPETIAPRTRAKPAGDGGTSGLKQEFGRYRILRSLGKGAMGMVYLAEDTQLQRQVALKTPHFDQEPTAEVLERFYREARAAATLQHPNICPVYDVGQIDGRHFISMAYIEGHALSAFIRPDKPQPERQILIIVRKLAQALEEAHARGIVHRDLKPANIMVDKRNEPIVMDFGLARQLQRGKNIRITQSGMLIGTPAYMSPEQVDGDPDQVGPRSDQFSLGVILYELLTGQLPFRGSLSAVLAQIVAQAPAPPCQLRPDLDLRIETVCLKMLAKDPANRFASMTGVAEELAAILRTPDAKQKSNPSEQLGRSVQRQSENAGQSQVRQSRVGIEKSVSLAAKDLVSLEELARKCLARHDYDQVIQIIERIPEKKRNAELVALLDESHDKADEIAFLICEIDEAVRFRDRQTALKKAGALLEIKPGHHRALEVQEQFAGAGAVRLGPLRQFTQPWNEGGWIPWTVLAFGVAVFGLMSVAMVIYLGRTGKEKTPIVNSADVANQIVNRGTGNPEDDELDVPPPKAATARPLPKSPAKVSNSLSATKQSASIKAKSQKPARAPSRLIASAAGRPASGPLTGGGHGLKGRYFRGEKFEHQVLERVDPQIDFFWLDDGPDPLKDHFSVRWEGWLKAPVPGDYQLAVVCDDGVRLWLDGKLLIDDWQNHSPMTGTVKVRMTDKPARLLIEYFQAGGTAVVTLQWRLEHQFEMQPIRADSLFLTKEDADRADVAMPPHAEGSQGLKFDLYRDKDMGRRIANSTISSDASCLLVGRPGPALAMRWSGALKPPKSGSYRLIVLYEDGVRLWLAGKPILKDWQATQTTRRFDFELLAASPQPEPVPIRIEHFVEGDSAGLFQIRWIPPGAKTPEVIPLEAWQQPEPSRQASQLAGIQRQLPVAPSPAVAKPVPKPNSAPVKFFGRPVEVRGDWTIENDELVQPTLAGIIPPHVTFGNPGLSTYDLTVEVKKTGGRGAMGIFFHSLGDNHSRAFSLEENRRIGFSGDFSGEESYRKEFPYVSNRWYSLRIEARGTTHRAYLDGVLQFERTNARFSRGLVGVFTNGAAARFRRIKLTDLERKVVLEGLPELPRADNKTIRKADTGKSPRALTVGETAAKTAQTELAERSKTPVISSNSLGMKLALIPPGEFQMGSPKFEDNRDRDEQRHRVRITQPFRLGVYEVTQTEFEHVMGRNPSYFSNSGGQAEAATGVDTSRHPVDSVTWYDAVEFCNKLSEKEQRRPYYRLADIERDASGSIKKATVSVAGGGGYRLPTEAQWEYACRAGSITPFNFGTDHTDAECNCLGDGIDWLCTVPVGGYRPNAFGLYDMHGNVSEWCWDEYRADYYKSSPVSDPPGPAHASGRRVFRGGGWDYIGRHCRSARRSMNNQIKGSGAQIGGSGTGFRVARDSDE